MENNILSIVNYNHYSPPDGFCFDDNCHDRYDPIRADKRLEDYKKDPGESDEYDLESLK